MCTTWAVACGISVVCWRVCCTCSSTWAAGRVVLHVRHMGGMARSPDIAELCTPGAQTLDVARYKAGLWSLWSTCAAELHIAQLYIQVCAPHHFHPGK